MEPNNISPVTAKRLWNIVRIAFYMMRKGIMKHKLVVDLHHLMMKRGKIAGKAIENLMFHQTAIISSLRCRPNDVHLSYVSPAPREYEFSCSNSPAFPFHVTTRRRHHNPYYYNNGHNRNNGHFNNYLSCKHPTDTIDAITTVSAVQKVLEMLNNNNNDVMAAAAAGEASPLVLTGFGRSTPRVRQLRVTDSPFPLKNPDDDDCHVDEEAEAFIKRFYEQLKLQKR
ncbi:hypothetical protein Sjap_011469 [Stephania japonica]|uniref:Avr9/Cf-9 rapidly elicited protein n=1 Tax=Stephania japonica TaxID=461633 RepID=A0AAP0JDK0_9MAGN